MGEISLFRSKYQTRRLLIMRSITLQMQQMLMSKRYQVCVLHVQLIIVIICRKRRKKDCKIKATELK